MKPRAAWLALLCLGLALGAGAQSFGTLARRMGVALAAEPVHPKLIGLFTFFTPVRVAVFTTNSRRPLEAAAATLGPEWQRMVRTRTREGGESLIYVRPRGRGFRMLILNRDGGDPQVQIVALKIKPGDLIRALDQQRGNR